MNKEEAKSLNVIDAEATTHNNFKLPLFVNKNGKAHLVDSSRHFKSKLAMEGDCRQQIISYIGDMGGNKEELLANFLATPGCLLFGYLATSAPSVRRASCAKVTSFVDKLPTSFKTEIVTQRGPKTTGKDGKSGTNLSYTVSCKEVEMEGEIFIDLSELSYIPVGGERDRAAINQDSLEEFKVALSKNFGVDEPITSVEKYVGAHGVKAVAERAVVLNPEIVTKLVQTLVSEIEEAEWRSGNGHRKVDSVKIIASFEDGSVEETDTARVAKLLTYSGVYVDYQLGQGIYSPPSDKEIKDRNEQKKLKALELKRPKSAKKVEAE